MFNRNRLFILALFSILLAVVLFAHVAPALAQGPTDPGTGDPGLVLPDNFQEWLKFIGTPVFFGAVLSFLAEHLPGWKDGRITSLAKFWIVTGLAVLLSVASFAAVKYIPASISEAVDPWYKAIIAGLIMAGAQAFHYYVIKAKDRETQAVARKVAPLQIATAGAGPTYTLVPGTVVNPPPSIAAAIREEPRGLDPIGGQA